MLLMKEIRNFSKIGDALAIPSLTQIQTESYARFLQYEVDPSKRKNHGLESLLREVFPIESYDGNMCLEYLSYDLGKPRYTPDECRQLRLTYGMPFRIRVRHVRKNTDEISEDAIYLELSCSKCGFQRIRHHDVLFVREPRAYRPTSLLAFQYSSPWLGSCSCSE